MKYKRHPIEIESPEQLGYENIQCNLTESSFADERIDDLSIDLKNLVLAYGDHLGHRPLRKHLAKDYGVAENDILIVPGAASALFIVATSLLETGDEIVVVRPNYATNIETPKAIGANIRFVDLEFENGFQLNVRALEKKISTETKLISITTPHNPTGTIVDEQTLKQLVSICESKKIHLLVDETYRDMNFSHPISLAATLSNWVISVSSLSKTYGLPGIRMGWLVCKNPQTFETFLAAKEQIFITNSLVDEVIAYQFLEQRNKKLPFIRKAIDAHRQIVKDWIEHESNIEWVEPVAGCVCFPRIKNSKVDVELFYKMLNEKYKTYVGPGHWFDMDKKYMRIGYGWPTTRELHEGLENISRSLKP